MAICSGFSHEKLPFSIAMLNYQRVQWIVLSMVEGTSYAITRSKVLSFHVITIWGSKILEVKDWCLNSTPPHLRLFALKTVDYSYSISMYIPHEPQWTKLDTNLAIIRPSLCYRRYKRTPSFRCFLLMQHVSLSCAPYLEVVRLGSKFVHVS